MDAKTQHVLIIGGDSTERARCQAALSNDFPPALGLSFSEIPTGRESLAALDDSSPCPSGAVLLSPLPDMEILTWLQAASVKGQGSPPCAVVIVPHQEDIATQGPAWLRAGAQDYWDPTDRSLKGLGRLLFKALNRLRATRPLLNETQSLRGKAAFQRQVLDRLFAFVGVLSLDGTLIQANSAPLDIAGLSESDVLGKKFWDCYWWSFCEISKAQLREAIEKAAQGDLVCYDARVRIADESLIWIEFQLSPMPGPDGGLSHLVAFGVDITERKLAEHASHQSEQKLRAIFDGTLEYIGLLSPEGILLETNQASLAFAGSRREDVIGLPFWNTDWFAATPGAPEAIKNAIPKAAAGESLRFEADLIDPQGSVRTFDISLTPIRDDHGNIVLIVPESRDITQMKKAQKTLQESEERLAVGVQVAKLGLAEVDYASDVYHLTAEAARMFGVGDETMTLPREQVHAVYLPEDREKLIAHINGSVNPEGDGSFDMEYRIHHSTGELRWLRVRKQLFFEQEESGKRRPVRAVLAALDITSEKQAADVIRASEERFRNLFEHAPTGIVITDVEGNIERCNPAFCRLIGYPHHELQSLNLSSVVHPDERQRHLSELEDLRNEKRPHCETENRYLRKDGAPLWVHKFVSLLRVECGEPLRLMALVTDITERRQAETALHQAGKRKDEFLAMLGHELRNPLAAIRHAIQIDRESFEDRDAPARLWAQEVIDRQSLQLTRMVDDLLDVGRITRGRIELRMESVSLCRVLKRALDVVHPLMLHRHQKLRLEDPSEDLVVRGDAARLEQVFVNLLNNAAKYTPPDGIIHVIAEGRPDEVVVRIVDSGIGIEQDVLPHLFDLFRQADTTPDRAQGGLGIGLTVVKSLVERHRGHVTLASAGKGLGSTCTVRFPRQHDTAPSPDSQTPCTEPPSPHLSGTRILVVDDHLDAAQGLARLLTNRGCHVRQAYTGHQALEVAADFQPHVFLLDLGLPGLDGFEVARALRSQPRFMSALFIAISGYAQESDRAQAHDAGFDHHFAKPLNLPALLEKIKSLSQVP